MLEAWISAMACLNGVASRFFEELKDGIHCATASDSVDFVASSLMGGCSADRMTAEVFWMTSKLSARSAALPG